MYNISGGRSLVPITAEPGLDSDVVNRSAVFKQWVSEIDKDKKLFISDIHIQSIDMFGTRVGFLKFKTTANVNVGGERGVIEVPGIVFMRGGAVGILVILECEDQEYTILTRQVSDPHLILTLSSSSSSSSSPSHPHLILSQARVPVGVHDLPEIPAGMLDGSGNFKGVAAEEMREECDIDIQEKELVSTQAVCRCL